MAKSATHQTFTEARQTFITKVATYLDRILPDGGQGEYIRQRLESLSQHAFERYVKDLVSGKEVLPLTAPNLVKQKLSIQNNIDIAEELGHSMFKHLRLTDQETGKLFLTPEKYMVIPMMVCRQRQILREKISIPEGTRHIDELSGQVTGPSKGSKISGPELQILYSQDLTSPIIEFIKYRGGDVKGQQLMYRQLMETGQTSLDVLGEIPTEVKSTRTLHTVLGGMMLKSTLFVHQGG